MSWNPAEEQERPRITPVVQALIAINVAVAFLQATIVQPAELNAMFAFREGPLSQTWWTAFTYMFLHKGLLHLALNMYTLWIFAPRLEAMWGARGFALFYVWCGLGGAVFHAAFGDGSMVGASAAVYGTMLAYALQWPKDEIYLFAVLPMRVFTLVMLVVAIDLLRGAIPAFGGDTAYFAHLGGVAFAFLYLRKPQQLSVDQLRQRVSPAPDVGDDISPRAAPRTSRSRNRDEVDEIVAQSKAAVAKRALRMNAGKQAPSGDPHAEELDRVLDKISRHGLNSLTPAEKRLLEDTSRQLRDHQ
jgi:membrane associated rhomboid family serine protease